MTYRKLEVCGVEIELRDGVGTNLKAEANMRGSLPDPESPEPLYWIRGLTRGDGDAISLKRKRNGEQGWLNKGEGTCWSPVVSRVLCCVWEYPEIDWGVEEQIEGTLLKALPYLSL